MRLVFFGNHTVGVRTLAALAAVDGVDIAAVVAHPVDPEDGVAYESVHDAAITVGIDVLRGRGKDSAVLELVRAVKPDLVWLTDYRYLVPSPLFTLPRSGAVNLHPSLLPRHRGRAPLNWAILAGERTIGLTAHFVDEGIDTGDIIAQRSFELGEDEDVGDALERLYPLYGELATEVAGLFVAGDVPRRPQPPTDEPPLPPRRAEDGRIDWTQPAETVHNLVRAVARPYPGARTSLDGRQLLVWRARRAAPVDAPPGTVVAAGPPPRVACGDGSVELLEVEWEGNASAPDRLEGRRLGG